ncbi:immune inhibitor A domain-containing protein [Kineosporia succinea]|uniref:Immune inhibitor A peptidase M6 n=1 Tax=Kineosporia succinea TaxID=84632 RepID=A0ABT9P861_9ACTN|nr:immune inhibitor A domain-containing protein [Kineosporia succinea]MDP9828863.1 hypothetical protein [Kineosporia succinea]
MARKRAVALIAAALALPLGALASPARAAVTPVGPDAVMGSSAPLLIDGEKAPTPERYRPAAEARKAGAAGTPEVGTVRQWLADDETAGFYRKDFTLRGVGDHIEVWVANDLAFPEGDCRNAVPGTTSVSDAQVAGLVHEFDTNIYPEETAAFSTPPARDGSNALLGPDDDGNGGVFTGAGEKTVTLVDNIRDDNFYVGPSVTGFVGGFFVPFLNEQFDRNVMTIDAFDWTHRTTANPPDAATPDLCTSRPARPRLYEGIFAHEWQHLLHYYNDPFETVWVDEGLADYAMALTGYSNSTATVNQRGHDNHLICYQGWGPVQTPYNPNPRDCGGPQNSLNLWGEDTGNAASIVADYGHPYALMLYLRDHYGPQAISELHRDGDHQGLAAIKAVLGSGGDLYGVLHDFQSSILLDAFLDASRKSRVEGVAKERVTSASMTASVNLGNPQSYADPGAAPNGADYVRLTRGGAELRGKDLDELVFRGARTLPVAPLAWTIVNDDPDRPGDPVLFSGDGDNIDAALVTAVTVPAADPTLRFRAKYGAEATYDYGYVSVSTDGGKTYGEPIPGSGTVDDGPLGPGLNGTTEGFEPQEYDLSAYAGRTILVSIRYVSDGGVNEGGLLVDDVSVGARVVSDGSSLEPFDSPTEIAPVAVHHWNLRLVGFDDRKNRAYQVTFDGRPSVDLGRRSAEIRELRKADRVVAIVAYDEPTGDVQQYAPYSLTVNGALQPGGGPQG